ncbi:MAG: hypothetical protein ACPLY7_00405 [Microgenomates group bacterium]
MPKQILADTFETLGGVAKSAGQQLVADVKKTGEDIAVELGVKPAKQQTPSDQTSAPAQTEEQSKKIAEAAQKKAIARYRQIQAEIKALEEKRKKELPKEVAGKPEFSEEKTVKQLEVNKEEKKLPPLSVQKAVKKTEMFRGTSG